VGPDGKEVLHGDSKEKLDEEECHGDDKKEEDKEESLNGDGKEKEDNEEMPHGDGKEDKDEPGALHGGDKVGVNGEGMPVVMAWKMDDAFVHLQSCTWYKLKKVT
jgi:hypothetical protein